jgi:hypothetical protein
MQWHAAEAAIQLNLRGEILNVAPTGDHTYCFQKRNSQVIGN